MIFPSSETFTKIHQESLLNKSFKDYKKREKEENSLRENLKKSPPKKIPFSNYPKKYNIEDIQVNKFDSQCKTEMANYQYDSRKYSKDSANESTSFEDIYEKDQSSNEIMNQKNKLPYKSNASDFKIKYKTELCKYFEINGCCKFGDNCAYAHGKENLRSKVTNSTSYRTKECVQFFERGYCPYGNRCQFAHQLKTNIINNPYDRKMTYRKIIETISKLENVENIKSLINKPRLKVFSEIFENKEQIKSSLLSDIKMLNLKDIYERINND